MRSGDWERGRKVSNPFGELSRVLFLGASEELAGAETVYGTFGIRRLLTARVCRRLDGL